MLPMMICKRVKANMAANWILLVLHALIVVPLSFAAAKRGKPLEKFLKSDHTNNWAVLVSKYDLVGLLPKKEEKCASHV